MMRTLVGFIVAVVLAAALLAVVWLTFPVSATPGKLASASFDTMAAATKDLEAYPFLLPLDENVQAVSWRLWINDHSASASIFMIGAERLQAKIVKLGGVMFGGILLAFAVRFIAKAAFGRPSTSNTYNGLLGRLALILMAAFVIAFLAPVAIANHPAALLFSLPLLIGFTIASTGKKPEAGPGQAMRQPIAGVGPFGPPQGYGQGGYPQGQQGYPQGQQGPYQGPPGGYQGPQGS